MTSQYNIRSFPRLLLFRDGQLMLASSQSRNRSRSSSSSRSVSEVAVSFSELTDEFPSAIPIFSTSSPGPLTTRVHVHVTTTTSTPTSISEEDGGRLSSRPLLLLMQCYERFHAAITMLIMLAIPWARSSLPPPPSFPPAASGENDNYAMAKRRLSAIL